MPTALQLSYECKRHCFFKAGIYVCRLRYRVGARTASTAPTGRGSGPPGGRRRARTRATRASPAFGARCPRALNKPTVQVKSSTHNLSHTPAQMMHAPCSPSAGALSVNEAVTRQH